MFDPGIETNRVTKPYTISANSRRNSAAQAAGEVRSPIAYPVASLRSPATKRPVRQPPLADVARRDFGKRNQSPAQAETEEHAAGEQQEDGRSL